MFERDFESARNYLRNKLPDYLRSKGINPSSKFPCLNPEHHDRMPSMNYSSADQCVRCFSCGASYDIFDLIGLDYGLKDAKSKFIKTHELYLGQIPFSMMDAINAVFTSPADQNPNFQIAEDYPGELPSPLPGNSSSNGGITFNSSPVSGNAIDGNNNNSKNAFNNNNNNNNNTSHSSSRIISSSTTLFSRDSATPSVPAHGSSGAFQVPRAFTPREQRSNDVQNSKPPRNFNSFQAPSQFSRISTSGNTYTSFAPRNSGQIFSAPRNFNPLRDDGFNSRRDEQPAFNFADYIKQCAAAAGHTSYFQERGISDEVVSRFRLGFDEHYPASIDQTGVQQVWHAVIIPYSDNAYMARNTDPLSEDHFRKKGKFELFNHAALDKKGDVFITEGEFDALSLETLGCSAVALCGTGNWRQVLEYAKKAGLSRSGDTTFYICLDNDKAGQEAARELCMGLYQLQIPYKRLDLSFPYKDLNEALVKNKPELRSRLESLDELLSYTLKPLPAAPLQQKFITSAEQLESLDLSPALYTFSARPQILRRLCASIISGRTSCPIVYAGSTSQWQYLSAMIRRPAAGRIPLDQNFLRVKLLEIRGSSPAEEISHGIVACRVQGETGFVCICDLTALTPEQCLATCAELGRICTACGIPVIALCSTECASSAESQALQHLEISLNSGGDFVCDTSDSSGAALSFVKFST